MGDAEDEGKEDELHPGEYWKAYYIIYTMQI